MAYIKTIDGSQYDITDDEYKRLLDIHNWRGKEYLTVRTGAGRYVLPIGAITAVSPDNVPATDSTVLLAAAIDRLAAALEKVRA